jgi:glycerol-3-phosphate dehydrogenase (NAD(P)+)
MGTACAILLAEHPGQAVSLWARDAEYAREMAATRENRKLLPGVQIPPAVEITGDIDRAVGGAEMLVVAIPTAFLRDALQTLSEHLTTAPPIVSIVKGLENETFLRPSEIIGEVLGTSAVVALGGPSHAEEISRRLPTSVVAASRDAGLAKQVQEMFSTDRFRVYTNLDIIGVELAGALKNVVAIAAGICDGLGFGDNAKAGLMTRGVVEMTRFGVTLGAEPVTFSGLAGIGDLITTCISPYGRNRRVGERLGRGEKLDGILASMEAVAEGVLTSRSVHGYAGELQIEMPIAREVYRVLFEGKAPLDATSDLMLRPRRGE